MGKFTKPTVLGFDSCRFNGAMITDAFAENLKPACKIIHS